MRIAHFVFLRFHRYQRRIVQPVIAALHLDDAISPRCRSRQSHSMHRAFSSAIAEAHHLYRKPFADFLRELPLHIVRHAEHRPCAKLLLHCTHHSRMAVPCHKRAETEIEIQVFISIDVVDVATLSIAHEYRIRIVGSIVAGYSERQTLNRLLVRLARAWRPLFVCLDFLSKSLVHNFLHPYCWWPLTALRFTSSC